MCDIYSAVIQFFFGDPSSLSLQTSNFSPLPLLMVGRSSAVGCTFGRRRRKSNQIYKNTLQLTDEKNQQPFSLDSSLSSIRLEFSKHVHIGRWTHVEASRKYGLFSLLSTVMSAIRLVLKVCGFSLTADKRLAGRSMFRFYFCSQIK